MTKQTQINVDLSGLTNLRRQLGSDYIARVGIFGGGGQHKQVETRTRKGQKRRVATKADSAVTNADIGLIQEMGSDTLGIPPRSWLRMPIETHKRDIVKFLGSGVMRKMIEAGNIRGVFKALGVFCEGIIDDAFSSGGFGQWASNAPSTIARKHSEAPLFDSGQLKRSVSSDVKKI